MSAVTPSTPAPGVKQETTERVAMGRIWWVGLLAIVASSIANVIVREIGVALGTIPLEIPNFEVPGVVISTVIQVGLGVIVFALIARFARRPIRTFTIVAIAALLLSFLNPIFATMGMIPGVPPIGVDTMLTLMVMHIVAGVITIGLLTTLTRER